MYRRKRFSYLSGSFAIAVLAVAAFLVLLGGSQTRAAPSSRPLAHTEITTDTVWGPGVVTVTEDVVIKNGATLVITPGTTVLIFTDTVPYLGGVSDTKIEIIVEDGKLVADGFITDTQIITPFQTITFTSGLGDLPWWGIRILDRDAGESVINYALVEMGTWGIYVENSSPTVTHSIIRYMWGNDGASGGNGGGGGKGGDGGAGYSPDPGSGYNGGMGVSGGQGGAGAVGADAAGIYVDSATPTIHDNTIYYISGGSGGYGGSGGDGIDGIRWQKVMEAGEEHRVEISYQADGAQSFTYALNQGVRFDALDVRITVVRLAGSKIPRSSLPTTDVTTEAGHETFVWSYAGLIPNRNIQLTLPEQLSFSQRVAALQNDLQALAALAPVWVLLFLASLAGLLHLDNRRLPVSAYLLSGLIFVLFYPALTFLSGLVEMAVAAVIVFVVISAIITGFLSLLLSWRKFGGYVLWLLVIFLGCFSLGMLTPWSGGALTLGGILLIGTFMWCYARRPVRVDPAVEVEGTVEQAAPAPETEVEPVPTATRHCPRCGWAVDQDYVFCPGCGYDLQRYCSCAACGHEQFVPTDIETVHCQRCGAVLKS